MTDEQIKPEWIEVKGLPCNNKSKSKNKMENQTTTENRLTLKWGTLKSWHFDSEKGKILLKEYDEIGSTFSAMAQQDTPRQKEIICELIDLCDGDTIYLDWDDVDASKQEAKEYVMNYGKE